MRSALNGGVALVLAGLALALAQEPQQQPKPQQPEAAEKLAKLALEGQPSMINLQSILEHQEALEAECKSYQELKVKELERLLRFNDENESLHLPDPLPVKVPAVCLFLFGNLFAGDGSEPAEATPARKLDIVNWVYNEEDIRREMATVKREAAGSQSAGESAGEPAMGDILKEFLYNPPNNNNNNINSNNNANSKPAASGESPGENEIEQPNSNYAAESEAAKLHENIEKMLASEEFKTMIDKNRVKIAKNLSPVILIPGLLGSRLQAKVDKSKRVNIFCSKQADWQDMWLSLRKLLPLAVDCWLDNVRLEFDPATGFSKQPVGVEARVPDFGSVESVRYLDVNQPSMTKYMAPLIERYEQLGYTAGLNLLAAPYDFRLAPQELSSYFADLRALIEKAFGDYQPSWLYTASKAANRKVTLVCHSMGCTHALIFLRQQSAAWRQSRIQKLIALSSPWGGSIKALKALVVGDQLELPLVSELKMRKLARTYPSIAYLLPQAEVFTRPNRFHADEKQLRPLVEVPGKVYTVNDIRELLRDLQLFKQLKWFNETSPLIKPLEPLPDLQVDCIHSLNTPTPETLQFQKLEDFPDGPYELIKGEGDGTVNFESLMVCADWAARLPEKVTHKIIMNTNHVGVLSHKATLAHLTDEAYTK